MWRPVALALAVELCCAGAFAEEAADLAAVERQRAESFLLLAKEQASAYEIVPAADLEHPLTLEPAPVLNWSNPTSGSVYGGLFLWTDRGCPAAAGALFKWYSPHRHTTHELHSLAGRPLVGRYEGRDAWRPAEPGVDRRPVPDADVPSESATSRLRQARAIAREFSAEKTDREGLRQDLRLLPQPIFRYRSEHPEVLDGAVFAFVQGTDPEVLLLIEARRHDEGSRWEYALARLNSVRFRVSHGGEVVWEVPTLDWNVVQDSSQVYFAHRHDAGDGDR